MQSHSNPRGHRRQATVRRFDRSRLPSPLAFYADYFGHRALSRRPSRGWVPVLCPFHPDHHPTLGVNLITGGFFCFACQSKGGDVVDFLMQLDGIAFREACVRLGCWIGPECPEEKRRLEQEAKTRAAQREQERRHEIELRQRYFDAEGALYQAEDIYRLAAERLTALRRGGSESFPGQTEVCWSILAHYCDEVRAAESAFVRVRLAWPGAPHNHAAKAWRDSRA
jgi:hypothetical protein